MRGLSPTIPSETDQARAQGVRIYEQAIAQLARRADTLENAWRQYGTSCYKGRGATAGLDRAWFVVFNDRLTDDVVAPGCDRWFADFRRQAAEVAAGVIAAEELARQADVYPGMRRDARRRYRLDYPGMGAVVLRAGGAGRAGGPAPPAPPALLLPFLPFLPCPALL